MRYEMLILTIIWLVVWLIRDAKNVRKFYKETVPEQLIHLVRQAHAGRPFNTELTEFNISVSANDREKLCYPLTPEQVEIIKATPDNKCQWKKFSYRVAEYKYDKGDLSGIVLVTIRFQDDSRNININHQDVPIRICLTGKPGEWPHVDSIEYL